MDADLIAALERAAVQADAAFQGTGRMLWRSDALLIRAHIDTLRLNKSDFAIAVAYDSGFRAGEASERAQIAALEAERDKLAGIVRGWHWLAVGPDEMGDYLHQRELIKASVPYADPALKAIARGAPQGGN